MLLHKTLNIQQFSPINKSTFGRIRTCDRWLRRPLLYPAELRTRVYLIRGLEMVNSENFGLCDTSLAILQVFLHKLTLARRRGFWKHAKSNHPVHGARLLLKR